MNILFIAPPAAGKGTQSEMVCKKYHIPHISTGDLLREVTAEDSPLAQSIRKTMERGELVSDEVLYTILTDRLKREDCQNGFVLDGFPRNVNQAVEYEKILHSLGKELGVVILLDVPKSVAEKRIAGRLSCPACGRIYNHLFDDLKPREDGICDDCGKALFHRSDDTAAAYETRYQTYLKATEPLIDYYRNKGVLRVIPCGDHVEETFREVEKIIGGNL